MDFMFFIVILGKEIRNLQYLHFFFFCCFSEKGKFRVLFIHPDLGIGGAERLVVDAAIALSTNYSVSFLTNHHDPNHCFEETRNGKLKVEVVGDWLPRHFFGKFFALCAYIRMVYAAFYTVFFLSRAEQIDVIFCDIVSLGIPILKFAKNHPKILFYCHFPDQLLSKTGSRFKQCYRYPLNFLEEVTTGQADKVLVNSNFTKSVYEKTFQRLDTMPTVLYPSLNTNYFDDIFIDDEEFKHSVPSDSIVFLSINRYERKKNLALAINALKILQDQLLSEEECKRVHLVIAGGYDERVNENIEYYKELKILASELNLQDNISFIKSPNDKHKVWLLKHCESLIYTPDNEHFGIVPLEGMYMGKPVIAVNSGGPTETILHEETGFLCEPNPLDFANAMKTMLDDRSLASKMGKMGRSRVQEYFSFKSFQKKLCKIINDLIFQNLIENMNKAMDSVNRQFNMKLLNDFK